MSVEGKGKSVAVLCREEPRFSAALAWKKIFTETEVFVIA
jgi:hypothetical protein